MFVDSLELNLYHLTLQRQSNYVHSCVGHFVDGNEEGNTTALTNGKPRPKNHLQLCIATETHLELYDVSEGSLKKLALVPVFAIVAAIETLHLENTACSFLAITSDSGNLTLAKFVRVSDEKIVLKTLLNQPLTRSGLRRLSPISYLQVDLHGRCLFLSAIERNILCFVANQFGQDSICLQDPLEALVPHSLTLDTTVCDVSYDNPCFASLEIRSDHYLVFYVLDLGLNHIVKKADYKLNDTANFLMGLPALSKYHITCHIEREGGGNQVEYDETNPFVLIGFENFLVIKDLQGYFDIKVSLPRRNGKPGPTTIICYAIQTLKKDFFVLLQSNWGDLFKLKIIPDTKNFNRPTANISYFDTIPQASNLHIFKNGYLFATSELNDNYLFQFESLGDDEPLIGGSFEPSVYLRNLSLVETQKNLNPLSCSQVVNAAPLTFAMSSLNKARFLTNGVNFDTTISTQLPAGADDIWTIKFPTDTFHHLLFLSYSKSTMILKTEEGTMEQLPSDESSFKVKADKTVFVGIMGSKSVVQVCENEMRQIIAPSQSKKFEKKLEWYPPAGIRVIAATSTRSQLAIALSNGEVAYFEMDSDSGSDSLHELQKRVEFNEDITGVAMTPGLRSDFLAVGNKESTIKILSLKKSNVDDFLEVVSIQALMAPVSDLKLTRVQRELHLHVGLENGVYSRSKLNERDGHLYDVKRKFLGSKRVTLSLIPHVSLTATSKDEESDEDESDEEKHDTLDSGHVDEEARQLKPCVVLHSTKTWVCYESDILFHIRPILLSNENTLIKVSEFAAENIKTNGCCALTSSHNLVIGKILDFISKDKWFHVEEVDLNEKSNHENKFEQEDEEDEERVPSRLYSACKLITFGDNGDLTLYIENAVDDEHVRVSLARSRHFFTLMNNTQRFQILQNMKAVSAVITKFTTSSHYLVISASDNKLYTFSLTSKRVPKGAGTFELKLLHTTQTEDRVHAMIEFKEKLLVPVFGSLILYTLGKKKLLKRSISQTTTFITKITALSNWKDQRIAVGDNRESVTLFCFDDSENIFVPIADDIVKRYVTCLAFLDQSTIIGGDKFGNIWTLRLSRDYEKLIKTNFPRALDSLQQYRGLKRKAPNVMDCPFKWTILNHFFVNDIPMHIQKITSVQLSDRPSIIYCGLQGTIGCLIPLVTKQEITNMKNLEVVMRDMDDIFFLDQDTQNSSNTETIEEQGAFGDDTTNSANHARIQIPEGAYSIVGRDHLKYRSYYAPVRNVIDGDLCETFVSMSATEQSLLCKQLANLKPEDVLNQVTEIRTNYI